MTNRRHRALTMLPLLALLVSAATLLSAACGTLEVGMMSPTTRPGGVGTATVVDRTTEEMVLIAPRTPTPVSDDYVLPTPEPAFTPMPTDDYPAPDGLRVVFVKDSDIWMWAAGGREPIRLIAADKVFGNVKISDDGEIVALRRGDELWMVNSDGTGERRLLGAGDLDAMESGGFKVRLKRFEWIPGTHTLAFNTYLRLEARDVPADDLHLIDADTLEQIVLLPPGEGGEFHYSPSGDQVAIVTTGDISLIGADGRNRRDSVLTYTPVAMISESDYYAQPVWAADGGSLVVAIPPTEPHAQPFQRTIIWHIPADGTSARFIADIAAFREQGAVAFSHELNFVAYGQVPQSATTPTEKGQIWLKVMRLANGDWVAYPFYGALYGWAPNSRRFAFLADTGHQTPQLQIGQYSGPTIPGSIDGGVPVHDVRWIDADHYLFIARRNWEMGAEGDSWDLVLADVSGSSAILASAAEGIVYDFAQVPLATVETAPSPIEALCPDGRVLSTEPSTTVDTSDWQVFVDQEQGFGFRYPEGWRLEVFDSWVGVGPEEVREDVQWGVRFFDGSATMIEQVIGEVGHQFGANRTETRECVYLNDLAAIKVTVTTSQIEDWYAESIIFEHEGGIFEIGNGAVRDDRFEAFYLSFELDE